MVVLGPLSAAVPETLVYHTTDTARHAQILIEVQRIRGRVYLEDGAIEEWQLNGDGRHRVEIDDHSWHIVVFDHAGNVAGCQRYAPYPNSVRFAELGVSHSALARSPQWRQAVEAAVEAEIALAGSRGIALVEAGGWALTPQIRHSSAALILALAPYSLARILGGCIGLGTATQRHGSSSILKRIGGRSLEWNGVAFPEYYDPQYRCQMEILRFDSAQPNPKYESWIEEIGTELKASPVISPTSSLERLLLAVGEPEVAITAGDKPPGRALSAAR
jgi:hypothetical protein